MYSTHDNGGRPFSVTLSEASKRVEVFEVNYEESNSIINFKTMLVPRIRCQVERWWVGRSDESAFTRFGGGYGPEFDGNSILIKSLENEYIFVGECIFRFHTELPIVDFQSPVGNNDVPYPYAIAARGAHRRYYLFTFGVALDATVGHITDEQALCMKKDPNQYYLDHRLITADRSRVVEEDGMWIEYPIMSSVHEFDGITDFRIGGQRYTLSFTPVEEAAADFERMSHFNGPTTEIEIETNGVWHTLTSAKYIDIMRRFASIVGFLPFPKREPVADKYLR